MLMPGHSAMSVTFKWIVNSLLYENGHDLFIELFKFAVDSFCDHEQATDSHDATSTSSSYYAARPTLHQLSAPHDAEAEEELEEEDLMIPVLDYLTENPTVEPSKFEQLWTNSSVMYV